MLLYTACRILCSKKDAVSHAQYAKSILKVFVQLMPTYYGEHSVTMNVHNLLHIADDVVYVQAPLTDFSAYDFENTLYSVKRLVKSSKHSIAQIARKLHSLKKNASSTATVSRFPLVYNVQRNARCVIKNSSHELKSIQLKGVTVTKKHPNNILITKTGHIVQVIRILCHNIQQISNDNVIFVGYFFKSAKDLFCYPVPSRQIGIYLLGPEGRELKGFVATEMDAKCIVFNVRDKNIAVTLLHT